jgi:hypothetical protein
LLTFSEVQSILGNFIEAASHQLIKIQLAKFAAIGAVIKLYEEGYKAANMESKFTTELKEFLISTFKNEYILSLDKICALHKRLTERMPFWERVPTLQSEGYPLDCYIFSIQLNEEYFDENLKARFNGLVDTKTVIKILSDDNLDLLLAIIRGEIENGKHFKGDLGTPFRIQPDADEDEYEETSGNQ